MKPVLGPRAGVAHAARVLDARQQDLGADGGRGVERVVVGPSALREGGGGGVQGVEGDEDGAVDRGGNVLEDVHVVGKADLGGGGGGWGCSYVVPGGPGERAGGHELF